MGRLAYLTRTVWLSSLISLFTDLASEMLYPTMPLYLHAIGFSVFFIGLLEGAAEVVGGLLLFVGCTAAWRWPTSSGPLVLGLCRILRPLWLIRSRYRGREQGIR